MNSIKLNSINSNVTAEILLQNIFISPDTQFKFVEVNVLDHLNVVSKMNVVVARIFMGLVTIYLRDNIFYWYTTY